MGLWWWYFCPSSCFGPIVAKKIQTEHRLWECKYLFSIGHNHALLWPLGIWAKKEFLQLGRNASTVTTLSSEIKKGTTPATAEKSYRGQTPMASLVPSILVKFILGNIGHVAQDDFIA